jgi:histidinol-phosphatase
VCRCFFRSALTVERKADDSPVTAADRQCEERIVEVLRAAFPDYGVLGEELGESEDAPVRWIIDPIDGTNSFIRGIPYFASLIALEEEGEVTVGIVHAPMTGDLLYARRGAGAYDQNGRVRVSEQRVLAQSMLVFGGASVLRRSGWWAAYERLVDRSGRQRGYGDYFGYTFVMRGQAEAMIDVDLKPWDLAALKVIVEEAGGRFTDFEGRRSIYSGTAVASNGCVHDEILSCLNEELGGEAAPCG